LHRLDYLSQRVNMIMLRSLSWLGIASLYVGFAAVLGLLLRGDHHGRRRLQYGALALAHFLLLYLPATALVLGFPGSPLLARLALILSSVCVAWLSFARPRWLPQQLFCPAFGLRYFGGAMALATLWALGVAISAPAISPSLVATAACLASVASLSTATRHA
jgi:hypothetical protein